MCTGLLMNYPGGAIIGRNMDVEIGNPYQINYIPRNHVFAQDLLGNELVSRYKFFGVGFHNYIPVKDGVNEHGMAGITNDFPGLDYYKREIHPQEGVTYLRTLDFLNYLLANFRNIEEVKAALPSIEVSYKNSHGEKVISPAFHFMLTDATGACVVLEPEDGYFICKDNPYKVMTNTPKLETHYKRLERYVDPEHPEKTNHLKGLPGGFDPISRFTRAFYFSQMSLKPTNQSETLSYVYSILSALSLPAGFIWNKYREDHMATLYTSAYDPITQELYVQDFRNPKVYRFQLNEIENPDNYQMFEIPTVFESAPIEGN